MEGHPGCRRGRSERPARRGSRQQGLRRRDMRVAGRRSRPYAYGARVAQAVSRELHGGSSLAGNARGLLRSDSRRWRLGRVVVRMLVTGGSGFIGTHFIELVRKRDPLALICNVDVASPKMPEHQGFWLEANILEPTRLSQIFAEFNPSHVVHMAARTDTYGITLDDYNVNVGGSGNVIEAIRQTP